MKRTVLFSLFAVCLAFALPLLLSVPKSAALDEADETPPPTVSPAPTPTPAAPAPVLDSTITLSVALGGSVKEMTMAEYLPMALAGEMPASFDLEALKAQAVALRSYALYYRGTRKDAHPEADICVSSGCCAACASPAELRDAWGDSFDDYYAKLCAAVEATDGQYLVWEAHPALTVFHASSSGCTEAGSALGMRQDYLVSVSTPETADQVHNLCTTVEVSAGEFQAAILAADPSADLSGPPESWAGRTSLSTAGRVTSMEIGGREFSGLALRQLFALRSTDFALHYADGIFVFSVRGYGHGLGMSQYGANLMAAEGSDYAAILRHYYPGTELVIAMHT